ncbi:MAG TPA: DNA polymerase III subunit beta, partial [Bacteroidia bacterium]|nr:DNA polymerase III subunit beta [Bacteroidia bacterium]
SGSVAVNAKILIDTLKTFAEQPLTFTIKDKSVLEISSDSGKYKISGSDASEFPKLPELSGGNSVSISSEVLLRAISKTLFATGNDEIRPVMTGVFCQMGSDQSIFVATDAHRLVRYTRKDATSKSNFSFILPKKPLNLLKNILNEVDEKVKIEYNDSHAFFSLGNHTLICRLIDGRYPNYEAVIPVENPNKMIVDRDIFLNVLRRASIYSNKTTHQVKFKITGSSLQVSAEDVDFSNNANEVIPCNYEGEDMEIAFNARFVTEILSNLDTDQVMLEMSLNNRAGLFSPVGGENASESILMLAMPVMISN